MALSFTTATLPTRTHAAPGRARHKSPRCSWPAATWPMCAWCGERCPRCRHSMCGRSCGQAAGSQRCIRSSIRLSNTPGRRVGARTLHPRRPYQRRTGRGAQVCAQVGCCLSGCRRCCRLCGPQERGAGEIREGVCGRAEPDASPRQGKDRRILSSRQGQLAGCGEDAGARLSLGADYVTFRPIVEYDINNPAEAVGDRSWVTEFQNT